MPIRSSIEAIHLLRSLTKKYKERQRDLHMAFLNFEKSYNSVPCKLIWRNLIDKGILRIYVRVTKDMYEEAKIRVRTTMGNSEFFPMEVGLHQGSPISPYLLTLILDELSRGIQGSIPWCMIFENNIVLVRAGQSQNQSKQGGSGRIENAKMREGMLRWFAHVRRRPQSTPLRRVKALVMEGLRRRSRPKLRWEDRLMQDMKELLFSEDMTSNRNV
ncbi:probable LRR receptor-like serine/threonine-protein kinase RFK1 isoform X1 [Tanacetum coccineum]